MSANNRISTIVERQLPEFIRSDHPNFVALLTKYYEYLEQDGKTLQINRSLQDYADVDLTKDELVKYLKDKIIPDFPEQTALSKDKIIKAAKTFYQKKGTPDSFKFLFKVIYGEDIAVYIPKDDILRASDGKWNLPQAIRLSIIGTENENFDINLLVRRQGIGEISRTTCIIESANRTIDSQTGREYVELYVSNVKRLFENGENLLVDYGGATPFSSKIISLISNIRTYRNRFGVYQTGKNYNTGDPVSIIGGLSTTSNVTVKAVATVGNVSSGSIESVSLLDGGYLFRASPNSLVQISSASGIGASVYIDTIWDDAANSNTIPFNTDAILYKLGSKIYDSAQNGYSFDNAGYIFANTTGAGNTLNTVNLGTTASANNDYYKSLLLKVTSGNASSGAVNSATIISYNGTTKIATLASNLTYSTAANSTVTILANSNTQLQYAFAYENILLGKIRSVIVEDGGSFFQTKPSLDAISLIDTDYSYDTNSFITITSVANYVTSTLNPTIQIGGANTNTSNGFYTGCRLFIDVGQTEHYVNVIDYIVLDPGGPNDTRTLVLDRPFERNINSTNINRFTLKLDMRDDVRATGKIAAIKLLNTGSGYSASDYLEFVGTGYGAAATLTLTAGAITGVTLTNRGEGYTTMPTFVVRNSSGGLSSGTGAAFRAISLSDGEIMDPTTDDIGKIQDYLIINRGFDYDSTPLVSLRIVDVLTNNLSSTTVLNETAAAWQGVSNTNATFSAKVDSVYRPNTTHSVIRLYNYSGTVNTVLPLQLQSSSGNISIVALSQNATLSFDGIQPLEEKTYPLYYGNGLAKANAEFLNGLIKYNGYYLNTDGFISADKKLQNKDYYHNFSYEIQSERTLYEYDSTVSKLAHPAGTQLIAKTLLNSERSLVPVLNTTLATTNTAPAGFLTVNAFTSNANAKIFSSTTTTANVGDLLVIGSPTSTYRNQIKIITGVSGNVMNIESNTMFVGSGRLTVLNNSNVIAVANGTTNYVLVGDLIRFNLNSTLLTGNVISIGSSSLTLNIANSSITSNANNLLYQVFPVYDNVAFQIVRTSVG